MSSRLPDLAERRPLTDVPWRPPVRRRTIAAVNRAGGVLRRTGVGRNAFDRDSMLAAAIEQAGSDDFGTTEFEDPLAALGTSLEHDARLHFLGRLWARGHVVGALANRLRIEADVKRHPEILEQDVPAPIVVVGLPRSGTTLLQGLLGVDPRHRSLLHWEASCPSPPPEATTRATDPRIARAARGFRLVYWMVPEGKAIHALGAETPTECVVLLGNSLASVEFPASYDVPAHLEWFLGADLRPHYAYHKRQLQLLQWHCGPRQWVLKSPAHLFGLDAFLSVYPDARIVWIHRDPTVALASFCSLTATMHSLARDRVDPYRIGATWAPLWADALQRATVARSGEAGAQFADVDYRDLVANPERTVRAIYDRFRMPYGEGGDGLVRSYLRANPSQKHGVHHYGLAEFGLDRRRELDRFGAYMERFGVPVKAL